MRRSFSSIILSMSKWMLALIAVILCASPILWNHYSGASMLQDSDTRVLLATIRERQAPLSWFAGDWPLGNHFYRPISTLSFELDNALYGDDASGYGWTNALLCFGCVLLLFWYLRELTDKVEIAAPGAMLFALWHTHYPPWIAGMTWWIAVLSCGLVLLKGRSWKQVLLVALVLLFISAELQGIQPLQERMLGWLPSRTASVMALFALLALAAYARYERISARRFDAPEPTPLDPPATKGTVVRQDPPRAAWAWALLSLVAIALSFGSYEQSVILPGLLVGTALCLRLQRYRVRWGWQVPIWALLVGYLVLRAALVPSEVSGYQAQQFRSGPGVWLSLLGYMFPAGPFVWQSVMAYDIPMLIESSGPIGILVGFPIAAMISLGTNIAGILAARRDWVFPLAGLTMSFVAFLPMAWLKDFVHYHYLPMALRALFLASMIAIAARDWISAASRPALQAPPRLDPAPGSLPHP